MKNNTNLMESYLQVGNPACKTLIESDSNKAHNEVKAQIINSVKAGFVKKFPKLGLDIASRPKTDKFEWVVFLKENKATMRVEGDLDLGKKTLIAMIDEIYEAAYDLMRELNK